MRIASGVTDQIISFVAVDATDFATRETGLSSFTVYRSRNGGTATAMTTPTVAELDATNMPGVYTLLLDEDMTIGGGNDTEEMVFHITQASMAPVTRTIELFVPTDVAAALATYDAPTKAEMDSGFAGLNDLSAAQVNAEVDTAIGDAALATAASLATVDSNVDAILTDTNELQTNQGDWATATGFATAAAITALNDLSAADVNSEVDTAIADAGLATSAALATVDANVDAILVDTGTTIPAQITGLNDLSAADVNAEVDTALSDYDAPTNTEMVAAFTEIKGATFSGTTDSLEAIRDRGDAEWTTGAGGSSPTAADIRAEIDSNSTQLAAIVADTNELQTNQGDWATATGFATAADLVTVDANVDAILVDTGTTIPGQIAALNNFDPATDTVDVGALGGDTAALANLAESAGTMVTGAAVTGTLSTTQMSTDLTEATDDHYNGRVIIWTSGVLQDQATNITDYDGTTKVLTFTAVTEAPSDTNTFIIV